MKEKEYVPLPPVLAICLEKECGGRTWNGSEQMEEARKHVKAMRHFVWFESALVVPTALREWVIHFDIGGGTGWIDPRGTFNVTEQRS